MKTPVRTFALIVVAITSAFIMVMVVWSTIILASPDWCGRSVGAEKASPGRTLDGLRACINLMGDQISALAWNSHIYAGTIALCLLVLMVIVIAGGHVSFSANKSGVSGDIGQNAVPVEVVNKPEHPVPVEPKVGE